jgi:hypothetical protein
MVPSELGQSSAIPAAGRRSLEMVYAVQRRDPQTAGAEPLTKA